MIKGLAGIADQGIFIGGSKKIVNHGYPEWSFQLTVSFMSFTSVSVPRLRHSVLISLAFSSPSCLNDIMIFFI